MKENVVIIGGGVAGMEAAKQLLNLGYKPFVVEKSDHLGGHVAQWHKLFPDLTPTKDLIKKMSSDIKDANVFLETQVNTISKTREGVPE